MIIAAAFDKIADLYNSLPVTKEVLTLPILTTLKLMGRPFPSRLTTQTSSRSSSANTGAALFLQVHISQNRNGFLRRINNFPAEHTLFVGQF